MIVTPRSGTAWDAVAVAALLVPLAAYLAPLAGRRRRHAVVSSGRASCLVSLSLWIVVLLGDAAPEIGRFAPGRLGLAAAAGVALLAAALCDETAEGVPAAVAVAAPAAASVAAFLVGLPEPADPADPVGRWFATALVLAGAAVAVATAAAGISRSGWRLGLVGLPVALYAALRGGIELADPPGGLGVLLAAAALTLAAAPLARPLAALSTSPAASIGLAAAAVAVAPVGPARAGAPLLAAAAVLVAVAPGVPATLLTALPGVAVTAGGLADTPAPGDPSVLAHLAVAVFLAGSVVAVAATAAPDATVGRPPVDALGAAALLGAWLLVAPGSWTWAAPPDGALDAWDRAAAVAAAVGLVAVAVGVADRWRARARR